MHSIIFSWRQVFHDGDDRAHHGIAVVPPDSKFTAITEVVLGPNEFRQLASVLRSMGLADTYNARVTVKAIDGTGRVTAYSSVIDALTNDPTYIPAQ